MRALARRHREGALVAAQDLVQVAPQSAAARLLLGEQLQLGGQRAEAVIAYRRVLELHPRQPDRRLATLGLLRTGKPPLVAKRKHPRARESALGKCQGAACAE